MKSTRLLLLVVLACSLLLTSCGATPEPVIQTVEVEKAVKETVVVEVEKEVEKIVTEVVEKEVEKVVTEVVEKEVEVEVVVTATPGPEADKPAQVLKYAETGTFNNFNPWRMSATNMGMYNQVFSRLIYKDGNGNVQLDTAESWKQSSDKKTMTVKLRKDVAWHDGEPLVAQHIVDMFNYLTDPELAEDQAVGKMRGLMEPLTEVVAVDDYTVEFRSEDPVPYMADLLDYFFLIRIDNKADPAFMESLPIGTGPMKIVEWVPNEYSLYERNPDYYIDGLPYLEKWQFQRLEKTETLGLNLESGALDAAMGIPMSELERYENDPNYLVAVNNNSGSVLNIIVDTKKEPYSDPRVRKALSLSMDRQKMVEAASFGYAQPVSSVFWHPASLAYREDLAEAHQFDLDEAARLLEEAGVEDLVIDIHPTPRWPEMKIFCLIWQQDLAKIGVTMNVNEVEVARFYDIGLDGDLLGFGLHPWVNGRTTRDPAVFLGTQSQYRGDPEVNRCGYDNPDLEALVATGTVEPDEEKRQEIYWEINQMLLDDLPAINVMTYPRVWVWNKDAKGVAIDLLGNIALANTWLDR